MYFVYGIDFKNINTTQQFLRSPITFEVCQCGVAYHQTIMTIYRL